MSDEEEVVDPKIKLEEKCASTASCARLMAAYEQCAERIEAKGSGTCTGQYMDYVACIDNCAKSKLFGELK